MAAPSEVVRVEAALKHRSAKELEWARWYCAMRLRVPSARPPDVKFWSAMAERVEEVLAPPVAANVYPTKKKRPGRGLGSGPLPGESGTLPPGSEAEPDEP